MKITKERLTRIIKEEISNVLEIKHKSGDRSYQSPEREKELEAARAKIQNKMDILATKMDDFNDMLSAEGRSPTDEEEREYAELENEWNKQRQLQKAATPAPPPEPEPEPEKEEDSLDYRIQRDFSDVTSRDDRYAMSSIKALVPREIKAKGEDAISNFIDNSPDDSLLSQHVDNLFNNGNWSLRDVLNPKMWKSIK